MNKGLFTLLTASHGGVMRHSAGLESSTQLNSNAITHHHMPHHVHVDGINGTPAADVWKCTSVLDDVKRVNGPLTSRLEIRSGEDQCSTLEY